MSRLHVAVTPLAGLTVVERELREDHRGVFSRLFCARDLAAAGAGAFAVAQINHTSTSRAGSVRGLHFQHPPHAERKLVNCLRGAIFDVAVDLRRDSPTFLKWHGEILSRNNRRGLLIPEGFAHGFQALQDDCELIYLHTQPHAVDAEGGLDPADPLLGIAWPLPFTDVSERDRNHARITPGYTGI